MSPVRPIQRTSITECLLLPAWLRGRTRKYVNTLHRWAALMGYPLNSRIKRMLNLNCAEDASFALRNLPMPACTWLSTKDKLLFGDREARIVTVGTIVATDSNTEAPNPFYYLIEIELARNGDNRVFHSAIERWEPKGETIVVMLRGDSSSSLLMWMFPEAQRPTVVPGDLFMSLECIGRRSEPISFHELRTHDVVRVECSIRTADINRICFQLERLDVLGRIPGPARWQTASPEPSALIRVSVPDQGPGERAAFNPIVAETHNSNLVPTAIEFTRVNKRLRSEDTTESAPARPGQSMAKRFRSEVCGETPARLSPEAPDDAVSVAYTVEQPRRAQPSGECYASMILSLPRWLPDSTRRRIRRYLAQNSVQDASFALEHIPLTVCRWLPSSEALHLGRREVHVVCVGSVVSTEYNLEPTESMYFALELDLVRGCELAYLREIMTWWGHAAPLPLFLQAWALPDPGTTEIERLDVLARRPGPSHFWYPAPGGEQGVMSTSRVRPSDDLEEHNIWRRQRTPPAPEDASEPESLHEVINTLPHPLTPRTRERLGFPPRSPGVETWIPNAWNVWDEDQESQEWGAPTNGRWGDPGEDDQEAWQPQGALTLRWADTRGEHDLAHPAFHLAGYSVARTTDWNSQYFDEQVVSPLMLYIIADAHVTMPARAPKQLPFPNGIVDIDDWPRVPDRYISVWRLSEESQRHLKEFQQIFAWFARPHTAEEAETIGRAWCSLLEFIRAELDSLDGHTAAAVARVLQRARDILPADVWELPVGLLPGNNAGWETSGY
ncbi:hypothetical protein K466DRAFT_568239 [Polyporus arcularius HHB13444]|uniref:Uncharacterized protein n=1 Tax=Polyporus arcularius HHB13444 TaxID=1314778 RepID=A0A5C3NZ97_9APHY|nr:hypothetical protein K466DRAFT_568239 [Polyporus arcularius HHB13444]